jgi:hypothetical protein
MENQLIHRQLMVMAGIMKEIFHSMVIMGRVFSKETNSSILGGFTKDFRGGSKALFEA